MKTKDYDGGMPGIVGTVLQNLNGHLLVRGDFFLDKKGRKTLINGTCFAVHNVKGLVNFFTGDIVKLGKFSTINITEKRFTCSFSAMLSEEELDLLDNKRQEFIFNGFIEQLNILDNDVAFRFHVISRINSDGDLLRMDKMVNYCKRGDKQNTPNNFLNIVFSVPLKKLLTVKYSRKRDEKGKTSENLVLLGVSLLKNAHTFLKQKC